MTLIHNGRLATLALMTTAALGLGALPLAAQTASTAPAVPAPATEAAAAEPTPAAAPELLPDLALGREDAPLTIVEYASFTCPHCGDFTKETFPTLKAEYIDTGKVRFIQRAVYFDAPGLWAGVLAQCDPQKYYPVSEMLLTGQDKWLATAKTGEDISKNLRQIGISAGMTEAQMEACWADKAMVERLVTTYQINATKDGLEGTPTFIIGGEKVPNQAWDKLKATIDAKLAEAEKAAPAAAPAPAAVEPAAPGAAPAAPADAPKPAN